MDSIKIYAKVNLSLEVVLNNAGMHELDMVVGSCKHIYDEIYFEPTTNQDIHFICDNPLVPTSNTATAMCSEFMHAFGTNGGNIILKKMIPFEGGLGGSSAAAAGVCSLMRKAYQIDDEQKIMQVCKRVGSDVYYMTIGGFARLQGYGEKVQRIIARPIHAVISEADRGVNTKKCFEVFDLCKSVEKVNTMQLIAALKSGNIKEIQAHMFNHLQQPAIKINPSILDVVIKSGGMMSGSGSCVVSIYGTEEMAREAENRLPNSTYTLIF